MINEKERQLLSERQARKEKHLLVCNTADEIYQKCINEKLSYEDVEELCRMVVSKAKKSIIC